jgi:hypothetical protein
MSDRLSPSVSNAAAGAYIVLLLLLLEPLSLAVRKVVACRAAYTGAAYTGELFWCCDDVVAFARGVISVE